MNKEMINRYSNIYRAKWGMDAIRIWQIKRQIRKYIKPDSVILDIGCGDGILTEEYAQTHNIIGLDYSHITLKHAKHKGFITKACDIEQGISLPDDYCDMIIAGEIIEHINNTDLFISETRRVLKPKGYLILSTPNMASLPRRFKLLFGFNPSLEISPTWNRPAGHLRYFLFSLLQDFLKYHGFKIIKITSNFIPKRFGSTIIIVCQNWNLPKL